MNFLLHNRIEISNGEDKLFVYNQMLDSVLDNLKNLKSYNDYIALGTGTSSTQSLANYKLTNYYNAYPLEEESLQDCIDRSEIFIKKTAIIEDNSLDGITITEAGLTDSISSNPTIFNYFQLEIDDETTGITKQKGKPLVISIYIYLDISKSINSTGTLTLGNNKLIDFLLGNGISEKIYACRGNLLLNNSQLVYREFINSQNLIECETSFNLSQGILEVNFDANLGFGETNEIVLLIGDSPFARLYALNEDSLTTQTKTYSVISNNSIELEKNVKEVISVTNLDTNEAEQNIFTKKFAKQFGDKIHLPFNNIFDNDTSRFISKDGKMIFFVIENKIYGYKNENYTINELDTSSINIQNIISVVSFEDYVFVFSKSSPYLSMYIIENEKLQKCDIDLTSFENSEILASVSSVDITHSNSNYFMLGLIDSSNSYGYTLYFIFNSENKKLSFNNYLCSEFAFNYVLAMFKNELSDAMIIYLKADEEAYNCKIVYHYSDQTIKDTYSTISWYLTHDTKELYVKGRAIVVEQLSTPKIWFYLFPQISRYTLDISGSELNDYVSTNLKYLIQKNSSSSYSFYNLIGYDTVTEFTSGLPTQIDLNKILDFEFLDNVLLIFLNDENEKIIALSLLENFTCLENVSSNDSDYSITLSMFNSLGSETESVQTNFKIKVEI